MENLKWDPPTERDEDTQWTAPMGHRTAVIDRRGDSFDARIAGGEDASNSRLGSASSLDEAKTLFTLKGRTEFVHQAQRDKQDALDDAAAGGRNRRGDRDPTMFRDVGFFDMPGENREAGDHEFHPRGEPSREAGVTTQSSGDPNNPGGDPLHIMDAGAEQPDMTKNHEGATNQSNAPDKVVTTTETTTETKKEPANTGL